MAYLDTEYLWFFGGPRKRFVESAGSSQDIWASSSGAPMLIPSQADTLLKDGALPLGGIAEDDLTKRIREINVVNEFEWTTSPRDARYDTPVIRLKEMFVKANPMLNQIANSIGIIGEGLVDLAGGKGVEELTKKISDSSNMIKDFGRKANSFLDSGADWLKEKGPTWLALDGNTGKNNPLQPIKTALFETTGNVVDSAGDMIELGSDQVAQMAELAGRQTGDPIDPYRLLYSTEMSGFSYIFPYFGNDHKSLTNSWSETQPTDSGIMGQDLVEGLVQKPLEMAGNVMQVRNMFEPGKYIEQPQFYSGYANGVKSYQVSFPLSNTGTYSDVLKNWQLVYLLIYQNTQNRINRSIVAPPVIYEAEIPGVWFSPYAYISSLDVQYLGARRRMTIEVPKAPATAVSLESDANTPIALDTIIPDAYQVSFTITDMHPESQNFLHHMIKQKDKITTYDTWQDMNPGSSGSESGGFRLPILNKLKNLF